MKKIISITVTLLLLATSVSALDVDPDSNYTEHFSDFLWGDVYYDSVEWMVNNGVVQGYEDGTFKPDKCVNRAEFLKMLYLVSENSLGNGLNESFPDVDTNDWFYSYVVNALSDGVVEGYEDGTFKPERCMNRVEAMKMAVSLMMPSEVDNSSSPMYYDDKFIVDMTGSTWYSKYARVLFKKRLVGTSHTRFAEDTVSLNPKIFFYPDQGMTRKEVAEMLYRIKAYLDGGNIPDPLQVYCTMELRAGLVLNVTDQFGSPIQGAKVIVDGKESDFYSSSIEDQQGVYSGLYEAPGTYDVKVAKNGYESDEFEVDIKSGVCHVSTVNKDVEITIPYSPL